MGLSIEAAAASLGISADAATIALASEDRVIAGTLEVERRRKMENVLEHIATCGENESARVAAAKFLLETTTRIPAMDASRVDTVLKKLELMRSAVDKKQIVDIEATTAENPGPSV